MGHGRCYGLSPNLFDADDDGHAVVLMSKVSGDHIAEAIDAAQACPERAITVLVSDDAAVDA